MIYFFYGDDTGALRAKLKASLNSLRLKRPDAAIVRIEKENWSKEKLEELIQVQGLFFEKNIVVLDSLLEDKTIVEIVQPFLSSLKDSHNIFMIVEKSLPTSLRTRIEKLSEKVQNFIISKTAKKVTFNTFNLAETFVRGDTGKAWVLYREALMKDVSSEEIYGTLFWKIKTTLLTSKEKSTKEKLQKIAGHLVHLYHSSRRGEEELDIALERFLLGS
ncbi:MAG: hypothetical protein AAB706_01320 [Patescibacteria group bacterium]